MMNKLFTVGRLTADPTLGDHNGVPFASFT